MIIDMLTISVRQPFAWLIVNGYKDVENRSWKTDFRGTVFVHASMELHDATEAIIEYCLSVGIELPDEVEIGSIIGCVDIVDCVTESDSPWFNGPFGFVLENPRILSSPHPLKGRLGLFESGLSLADLSS